MIRWPIRAARAIARLFRPLQNLDVFVEDQGDEAFYTAIISKACAPGTVVLRVVGLGGREAVVSEASQYDSEQRALFLIDGDLSWVRGDPAPAVPRLHRLSAYCIENLLIHEASFASLLAEELGCVHESALAQCDFTRWRERHEILVPLFARFALMNLVDPASSTLGRAFQDVIICEKGKLPRLDANLVATQIADLDARLTQIMGAKKFNSEIASLEARIFALPSKMSVVSGKRFLLPLLLFHLKELSKCAISYRSFRYRMALKLPVAELAELRAAIDAAA